MMTRRSRARREPGGAVAPRTRYRPRVEAVEARLLLSTLTVTTTADSGAGSLRQAIMDSNASTGPSVIDFNISSSGPQTITPKSALPPITNPVTIDGTSEPGYAGQPIVQINGSQIFYQNPPVPPSTTPTVTTFPIPGVNGLSINAGSTTVKGLVINRFTGNGIAVQGNGRNTIVGNNLGTDLTGEISLGNGQAGVLLGQSRNNVVGGTTPGSGNLISGNGGSGVDIETGYGPGVTGGNFVQGNLIGTDATGSGELGNTFDGVTINASPNNTIGGVQAGAGNTIAFNGNDGVKVVNYNYYNFTRLNNAILSNSIYSNAALGIELGNGTNNPVGSATLASAFPSGGNTAVEGYFSGAPNSAYTVQFFTNAVPDPSGAGQGQTLLGTRTVTTDASGLGRIAVSLPGTIAFGQSLSATATSVSNSTSPFFLNTTVAAGATSDLRVQKTVNPVSVLAGGTVVYTINVLNSGPSNAHNVVLTDTLPQGLDVTSVTTTVGTVTRRDNGVVTVALGAMPLGDIETVKIGVTTTTAGTITNSVSVAGDQTDPNTQNNTATVDAQVVQNPNPLVIVGGRLLTSLNAITGIIVNFNQPLDAAQATNPRNYLLSTLSRKNQFTVTVPLNAPVYNPSLKTVTLTPTRPLALGQLFQLSIDGPGSAGLTDPAGKLLVGNTPAGPMGPWLWQISRGYLAPPIHKTPQGPIHHGGTQQVKLVESVTTRRVLTGPATRTADGTLLNNLPRLVETTGGTNAINTR